MVCTRIIKGRSDERSKGWKRKGRELYRGIYIAGQ